MENPSVSTENPTVAELKPKTGRSALVSSRGETENLPHQFQVATFLKPTFCEHCGDMIWEMGIGKLIFKQKFGVRCKVCSTVVHKCCESKVVNSCIAIDTSAQKEESSELLTEVNKTLESEGSHKLYFKQHAIKNQKYCNFCRDAFHAPKEIVCCEYCQYNLHKRCFKKLTPQSFPRACKKWFFYEDELDKANSNIHEWVEGNVESNFCLVCKKTVATRTELSGFNCSWCHSSVHNECIASVTPDCDLGINKELIVPPICVKRLSKEPHTNELVNFYEISNVPTTVTPLLVFINRKSGGQQGTKLFRKFNRILNPVQIFDLSAGGPAPGLELFKDVPNCKVLVCGGDGTAGWFLHTVDKMELTNPPGCAILPLGTGNDLARSLGWGPGYEGEELGPILYRVMNSKVVELDRWSVAIGAKNADGSYEDPKQVYVMNNYFSIGADAKVALKFHEQREAHPERFKSRIGNKISYTAIGSKAAFERTILNREMTVEANGQKVDIPNDAEGLVILNLDNYGAGINLWGTKSEDKFKTQSFRDGMFEVVTINSTFHLGAIKVHLANATRICQASEITLKMNSNSLAAQVDGEPWMQPPAIIHISHLNRGQMLVKEE